MRGRKKAPRPGRGPEQAELSPAAAGPPAANTQVTGIFRRQMPAVFSLSVTFSGS